VARRTDSDQGAALFLRDMAMLGISSLAEMKRELLVPARGPI
jgi:hypothetical protein